MNRFFASIILVTLVISCRQRVEYVRDPAPSEVSIPDSVIYFMDTAPSTARMDTLEILQLENPLLKTKENLKNGQVLFERYCKHCHGKTGESDAPMIKKEKYPPPPKYRDKVPGLTDGEIFKIIYQGKNLMPPNKHELDKEEIWSLVLFVRELSISDKTNNDR